MERGLLWLPLLGLFSWLAWSGWQEYQKVESYQLWARQFERAKYDIFAVLGQQADQLTWGKPTPKGPVNLETFSLQQVRSIQLRVNGQLADLTAPPAKGRAELEFVCGDRPSVIAIPFTEPALAAQWGLFLQQHQQSSVTGDSSG